MVPIADGSDLGGSLRNRASFCGVVGLRPTPGTVPSWPSADPWDPLATQGPMGRCAADVALLLDVIAGAHPNVPLRVALAGVPARLTAHGCKVDDAFPDLRGAGRILQTLRAVGFERNLGPLYDERRDDLEDAIRWNVELARRLTAADVGVALRERGALQQRVRRFFDHHDLSVRRPTIGR